MPQLPSPQPPWPIAFTGVRIRDRHPAATAFAILLACSALRLLLYWAIARNFGGASHVLCNYDCAWYEHTARAGYDLAPHGDIYANTANWAFFPLFPLLLSLTAGIAPATLGLTWAGILLSTLCFAGFGTLGGLYLQNDDPMSERMGAGTGEGMGGSGAATTAMPVPLAWLGLVTLWPGDLYFAFPYSEALFALLMTASLLALTRRRIFASAWACAALTATRPQGVLMVAVILMNRLRSLRDQHRAGVLRRMPVTVLGDILLPAALAPLGLFAFMAYLRWHMGDGLAFLHVQSAWNRHALPPWLYLWDGLAANDWGRIFADPARESLSLDAGFAILALLLALRQVQQRRYAEGWLIGASILMASSSGLESMPRFVLSNPIVIIALYRLATRAAGGRRLALIGLTLGLAQLLLVLAWSIGAPALA